MTTPNARGFYLGDDELLVDKDLHVTHYDVVSADVGQLGSTARTR